MPIEKELGVIPFLGDFDEENYIRCIELYESLTDIEKIDLWDFIYSKYIAPCSENLFAYARQTVFGFAFLMKVYKDDFPSACINSRYCPEEFAETVFDMLDYIDHPLMAEPCQLLIYICRKSHDIKSLLYKKVNSLPFLGMPIDQRYLLLDKFYRIFPSAVHLENNLSNFEIIFDRFRLWVLRSSEIKYLLWIINKQRIWNI